MDFPRWRIRSWTFHSSIARRGLPARSTPDHPRASGDCRVPALLSATTEQAAERRQLDLFLDGRDAFLVHEIVTSLALRDRGRAETGLGRLRDEHPFHPDLPALALLVAALHSPPVSPITHATMTSDIEAVRQSLAPAAYRLLGEDGTIFLQPSWKALGAAAADLPFDEAHPHAHRSWLCQQYGDWTAGVRRGLLG